MIFSRKGNVFSIDFVCHSRVGAQLTGRERDKTGKLGKIAQVGPKMAADPRQRCAKWLLAALFGTLALHSHNLIYRNNYQRKVDKQPMVGFSMENLWPSSITPKNRHRIKKYAMTAAILAGALDNPEKYIRMIMEMPSKIQRRLRSNRIEQAANLFSNATEPKHYLAPCWVYAADPRDPDKLFYVTKVLSKGDDKTYDSPWECTQGTQRGDGIDRGIFQLPSQDVKFGGDEMPLMAAVCNNDTESARTLLGLAPRSSRRKLKKIAQLING
mmetsp:Transcript_22424/g.33436  ORF Transcript_22424/g.33436 Transcript_22424/m.33436 type:complete len:270 (+) Transcript_22424:828-1637(+)